MNPGRPYRLYFGATILMVSAAACPAWAQSVAFVGSGVSISFANSGPDAIGRGVSIAFANSSTTAGRGVSIAFGTPPGPTSAPSAPTTLGKPGSTNPAIFTSEPVNTATGNYYNSPTDLTVPGKGLSFAFTRAYNSQSTATGPMPMGANWTHSYNIYLTVTAGTGAVAITQADGHQDTYAPAGGGTYTPQIAGLFNTLVQNADNSFTLTFKNQTKFNFSSAGQLLTIVDRNGNTQTLSYGGGTLASVTDTSGRAFSFAYDAGGRLITLTDPLGRTLHYAYDASSNLISFEDAMGNTTQYAYNASHLMTSATDPRGNVYMQNVYDAHTPAPRVVQQTNARGFVTTFAYDTPTALTTTVTDPVGNATKYVYDMGLRPLKTVDASGGVTEYTYDNNNLKTSETDTLGRPRIYSYDPPTGNLLSSTDPLQHTTKYTYDALNDLLTVTEPLTHESTFTYDGKGNLLMAVDAAGGTTRNTYDTSGQLTYTMNARNFSTTFQYDANGDRTQVIDALNNVTLSTYDAVGHLLTTKNPLSQTWTRTYDPDDRLLTSTDPLANHTTYSFDGNGNRTQITDANGNVTAYSYDANNNLAQVTDAAGGVTAYAYNGNDDQTGISDANSHTTVLAYDSLRRLMSRTDPLGRAQTYTYDATGNLISTLDGNGKTNMFTYDTLNRRVGAVLSDGKTVGYTYDAVGNRSTMTDWRGTTNYVYDPLNRVTSVVQPDGTVGYTYDAIGNRSSIVYADGKVVSYTYDALNRLTKTTDWSSQTTTNGYDAAGNQISTAFPNGAYSLFTYDIANRLVSVMNISGVRINSGYTYVLDKVGNRIEVASQNEGIQQYGYDRLYRLTSWASPSRQETRYLYDGAGNRLSLIAPTGTINYTYDAADQLLTSTAGNFAYDNNGNQISKSVGGTTLVYRWDAVNRLISVAGGSVNTQYQYDGDGNRVSQQTTAGAYAYLNDTASALPVVLNESGPDGNITYAYGPSLISESATGLQSFYQSDGLGSVATVTDLAESTKASYAYDPWGVTTVTLDLLANKNKYRFVGEVFDSSTGLVYLRARYYDPTTGRMLATETQPGLARIPGSLARYTYALANPIRLTDRNGRCPWCLAAIGAVVGGSAASIEYASDHSQGTWNWGQWGATVAAGTVAGAVGGFLAPFLPAPVDGALSSGVGDIVQNVLLGQRWNQGLGRSIIEGTVEGVVGPDDLFGDAGAGSSGLPAASNAAADELNSYIVDKIFGLGTRPQTGIHK